MTRMRTYPFAGSPEVLETLYGMRHYKYRGHKIAHMWYKNVIYTAGKNAGKPDLVAITLLADICFWYTPEPIYDEQGHIIGHEKRFKWAVLQRSANAFAERYGFTHKQVCKGLERLETLGVITQQLMTIDSTPNMRFIRLNFQRLQEITNEPCEGHVQTLEQSIKDPEPVQQALDVQDLSFFSDDVSPASEGVSPTGERVSPASETLTILNTNINTTIEDSHEPEKPKRKAPTKRTQKYTPEQRTTLRAFWDIYLNISGYTFVPGTSEWKRINLEINRLLPYTESDEYPLTPEMFGDIYKWILKNDKDGFWKNIMITPASIIKKYPVWLKQHKDQIDRQKEREHMQNSMPKIIPASHEHLYEDA